MYSWHYLIFHILAATSWVTAVAGNNTFSCLSLAQSTCLSAYNTTILNATHYAVGTLDVAGKQNQVPLCAVLASVSYGSDDSLLFALWLPDEAQYSSRFMAVGNGGQAGVINYADMMAELNSGLGFAVAGGDGGHRASDNDSGAGESVGAPGVYQPYLHDDDQVRAWLHNAISLFTPVSKALIYRFYGQKPEYSYFRGCSSGGAQGFSLAEFHPGLFDGIIAGCPANWFSHVLLGFLWNAQKAKIKQPVRETLTQAILDFIQSSVIEACDLNDGVKDNLIENPLDCDFDISSLSCQQRGPHADNTTCLTPAQISVARSFYQGPVRSDDPTTQLFPGLSLGSEGSWQRPQILGILSNGFSVPIIQNLVYQNLSYNPDQFNWASDVEFLDARAGPLIDAINSDLSSFREKGGKMIVWAGWADPNIAPLWSMNHIENITKATIDQEATIAENDFIKLVMVPGGGHCGANAKYPYIPAQYGFSSAMTDWVEKKKEPVAGIKSWAPTNGEDRTRRLCTWPQSAKFIQGGDVDDWESYTCQ